MVLRRVNDHGAGVARSYPDGGRPSGSSGPWPYTVGKSGLGVLVNLGAPTGRFYTTAVLFLALIVGIDRFMSERRALTNLVGNGVATLAVARWDGELDRDVLAAELDKGPGQGIAPGPG